jgi:hypothetical protein
MISNFSQMILQMRRKSSQQEEAMHPPLTNEERLLILLQVKDGTLTQEEAIKIITERDKALPKTVCYTSC